MLRLPLWNRNWNSKRSKLSIRRNCVLSCCAAPKAELMDTRVIARGNASAIFPFSREPRKGCSFGLAVDECMWICLCFFSREICPRATVCPAGAAEITGKSVSKAIKDMTVDFFCAMNVVNHFFGIRYRSLGMGGKPTKQSENPVKARYLPKFAMYDILTALTLFVCLPLAAQF